MQSFEEWYIDVLQGNPKNLEKTITGYRFPDINSMYIAWNARVPDGYVVVPRELVNFLLGETSLILGDKYYGFGDKPEGVGRWWWRKNLRTAAEG